MSQTSKALVWVAIILILVTGIIHGIDAKDSFEEAAYKGWLFYANALGALVAAFGIFKDKAWGWNLGLMIAVGSLAGYIASRTVGLPLIPPEPDEWLEPMGVASMLAEGLFVVVFIASRSKK